VAINHAAHTMMVIYQLTPGPATRIGPLAISGLTNLNRAYVESRLRWRRGESYNAPKVEETRRALIESGLLARCESPPNPILPAPVLR
jgi:outer membrane translocation and assembly module TamA